MDLKFKSREVPLLEKLEMNFKNSTLIPVPKLEEDCYDWYARHEAVLHIAKNIDPEIVLIGDSITHFWGGEPKEPTQLRGPIAWQRAFGSYRMLNMGFGWDRIQNVLWRLDHGEFDGLSPRLIVLNIGTNNLTGTENARENTPTEIVEGIGEVVCRLRSFVPSVRIIQMGIFPRGQFANDAFRPRIAEINRQLSQTAEQRNVEFLDIGPEMLSADGSISTEIMGDFTHPTEKGYQVWADALIPLLK
jgi:lysophospholipase L1-like esterase